MFAHHSRKVLFAALLAAVLAAPASASDGRTTTQMTEIGQGTPDMVASATSPTIAEEASQVPTKTTMPEPRARQKVTELRPALSGIRQPSPGAGYYRHAEPPLILGIGH